MPISRILLLLVSWLCPAALPLVLAADLSPEIQFAEGLRKRRYFDLAEKHFDSVLGWPGLSKEERGVLQFGRADLYEEWARDVMKDPNVPAVSKTDRSEELLGKALQCHKDGLASAPQDERASKSQFKIGTILKERAMTLKKHWEKVEEDLNKIGPPPDPQKQLTAEEKATEAQNEKKRKEFRLEIDKDKKDAVKLLQEAIEYFSKMAKANEALKMKLIEDLQKANEQEKREKLDKQKTEVEEEMVRAQFEWYLAQQVLGEIHGPGTPDGTKALEEAAKNFKSMGGHPMYGSWVIGKYAVMLEGYCYHLLKKYDDAFKKFDENLAQKDHEAINDVIQKTYFRKAMCAMDAKNYPMVVYTLEGLNHTVTKEDEKDGIEGIAKKYGTTAAVVREMNGVTTNIVKKADWEKRPMKIFLGMFTRFKGVDNDELGKAAKLLVSEGLVGWAKELRDKQEKRKEWMPKFSRGLSHAVTVAEGDDAWAYKATQLLAQWAKDWKEFIGEDTPILFYAEGIYSFIEGYQAVKNSTEQVTLYDQAVRAFQKFTALGEMDENRGKEEMDDDKLVDSWYKMGVAYHATNRLHEAALAWNACARYFPKDPKGQKAGYLSTIVHGQIYKTKKPPENQVEGYFYEETLRDFITLFPEHEKAADCQYFIAQLLYARGDFAQAAVEFAKVPQVSRFYEQAIYLESVCHSNHFYQLYNEKKGTTDEARQVLTDSLDKITGYIGWVETQEPPDDQTRKRRKESQAKSVFRLANLYLIRALTIADAPEKRVEDAKKVIEATDRYAEEFTAYLTRKDQAELFPQVFNLRLKAFSEMKDLAGAEEMLGKLLSYPDFKDLANAFKYVAQDKTKAAEALAQQAKTLKEEGKAAESDALDKQANELRIKAAELYGQLVEKVPQQDPSIYLFTGDTYYFNNVFDKAVRYYQFFLKNYGNDPKEAERVFDVKYRLGLALFNCKAYKDALTYLQLIEAAYAEKDDDKRFLMKPKLGACFKAMGEFDKAITNWASYRNSIQQETKDWWEAVYEIGDVLYAKKDYAGSLKHLLSTGLMYPSMGGPDWKPRFVDLLNRLKEVFKNDAENTQKIGELLKKLAA
ncbi:MAG: tetratricopeptide repeat protein [Planctomycetes bacterium]|nr:tetratricopeptide repeat protein [Planctomycetota bacterium]